jgi:hypothetical protein
MSSVISLGITSLRMIGERQYWSDTWFNSETLGMLPSGVSWVIDSSWLALPFGAYFAWKLAAAGHAPESLFRAFACVSSGLLIILINHYLLIPNAPVGFPYIYVLLWAGMAVAGIIQMYAWSVLFNTLFAYGLATRIPVLLLTILAMRGNWGTHYDFVRFGPAQATPLVPRIFWYAVFPQLVFWVAFTIFLGMLAGVVTFSIVRKRQPTRQAAGA